MNQNTIKKNWFKPPVTLHANPTVIHLMAQREKALETMIEVDAALRNYTDERMLSTDSHDSSAILENLTTLQAKVLDLICANTRASRLAYTVSEVAELMGARSVNSAVSVISALCKKGYMRKSKGKWRGLMPIFNSSRKKVLPQTKQ